MYEHEHKFFIFQVKADFVPSVDSIGTTFYERVEFAILGCNCGEVLKKRVKENTAAE